jgi:hypothetical protein
MVPIKEVGRFYAIGVLLLCSTRAFAQCIEEPPIPPADRVIQWIFNSGPTYGKGGDPALKDLSWTKLKTEADTKFLEAYEKGRQASQTLRTSWALFESSDTLSNTKKLVVGNTSKIGNSPVKASFYCRGDSLELEVNLQSVNVEVWHGRKYAEGQTFADARMRVDGKIIPNAFLVEGRFPNVFSMYVGTVSGGHLAQIETYGYSGNGVWENPRSKPCSNYAEFRSVFQEPVHDLAFEMIASGSSIYFEITPQHPAMAHLLTTCRPE